MKQGNEMEKNKSERKLVKISEIKTNPANPRIIKDDKFDKLVKSIKEFPQMLAIRPIVVNKDMIVLGGNMRLRACKKAGLKEVHIIKAEDLTDEQQKEFIIKDNVGFGEFDWDVIADDWDAEKIEEWGLDMPTFEDFSDKNKEIDIDDLGTDMVLKLTYNEEEYNLVKDALLKIAPTPEQAIWKLLNL